jgi:F0F1-type ATP synthase assembly protein I
MSPDPRQDRISSAGRFLRGGLQASMIGFTLVLATVIGFGFGLLLDRLFHTGFDNDWQVGWFTLLFTILGIIAGFREMVRTVIRLTEHEDRNEQ